MKPLTLQLILKSTLQLTIALIVSSLLGFTTAQATEIEKSKIRSDKSYLDAKTGTLVYQDNVIYQHGEMTIHAHKLTHVGNQEDKIIAEGNESQPVKIHYVDALGETTDIDAPQISYQQKSGDLVAEGANSSAIRIVQTSNRDKLTLIGNRLDANKQAVEGLKFVLKGAPTRFILNQPQQPEITATAAYLRSNGKHRTTQLVGNVKLQQGTSSMSSASLTYDGATKVISANKAENSDQRVETEFFWEKQPEQQNPQNLQNETEQ